MTSTARPRIRLLRCALGCAALSILAIIGCSPRVRASHTPSPTAPSMPSPTQAPPSDPSKPGSSFPLNEDLRAELRALARADLTTEGNVRDRNEARLREIIQEYGWPGNSLVGRDGARAAWLIAQHADFDVPFQRECLGRIEAAFIRGDVDGHDLAYLTDRIAAAEGRAQVYGTQGAHAYTPEEEAVVDARRRAVGLPSLAEFRAMIARGEYWRVHEPSP